MLGGQAIRAALSKPVQHFFYGITFFWLVLAYAGPSFAQSCRMEKKTTLSFNYTNYLLAVPAKINGTAVSMGLDTGAQTLVTPETVSHLHLGRDYARRTRSIGTTAIQIVNNVIMREFEFAGSHHDYKSVASISITSKITSGQKSVVGTAIAGLLGADILSEYDLDFDFKSATLTLYRVKGCKSVTPPWIGTYATVPIRVSPQRRVLVPVEVDGVKLTAIFDTGANQTALNRAAALRVGLTSATLKGEKLQTVTGIGDVSAAVHTHQFQSLSAAGITLRNRIFSILKVSVTEGDMLLGRDFMGSNRIWVSYATRTMFVQPQISTLAGLWRPTPFAANPGPIPTAPSTQSVKINACDPPPGLLRPPECDLLKLRPTPQTPADEGYLGAGIRTLAAETVKKLGLTEEHALLVTQVMANGPAAKAGLTPGDVLLALDDMAVLNAEAFILGIRRHKPNETVHLKILRRSKRVVAAATLTGSADGVKLDISGDAAERTIAGENAVLNIFRADDSPEEWAIAHYYLAGAYTQRIEGTTAENLEQAIKAYEAALSIPAFRAHAAEWATAQERLGNAYKLLRTGDEASNLEHAIKAYEVALTVKTPVGTPQDWWRLQRSLAAAYEARIEGDREANMGRAISAYRAALITLTSSNPKEWSATQASLGELYRTRTTGDRSWNIEHAIKAYEAALSVKVAGAEQQEWAKIKKNLGLAYESRVEGDHAENVSRAVQAYEAALGIFNRDVFPRENTQTQSLRDRLIANRTTAAPGAH
jgi:predicted aspartyl protease/tetratricopeptide (TPR) repeat protein